LGWRAYFDWHHALIKNRGSNRKHIELIVDCNN
jgi:hypothetical protein